MADLIHCIYSSRAAPSFNEHELPALLEQARAANAARQLTGMLLYVDHHFFQVLEGRVAAVDTVFEHICRDSRHTRVTRIIHEPIFERDFSEWTMGFAQLDARELAAHAGINDFFSAATCLNQLGPGRARRLLQAFRTGRWRSESTGMHPALARMG